MRHMPPPGKELLHEDMATQALPVALTQATDAQLLPRSPTGHDPANPAQDINAPEDAPLPHL